jgi:hypothetical protein
MLRGIASITAAMASVCLLTGCSSADPAEATASTVQADSVSPACSSGGQGGASTVTLLYFDAASLDLFAVNARGSLVVGRLTADTVEVAANLRTFPPDPIVPQCTDDATTYDEDVGDGLTRSLLGALGALANDGCDASITVASDGTVTSFQPVP